MNCEKGSEWRRWELHIHTPGTQKNDNFDGASYDEKWNKYYEDIHTYIGTGEDPLKNIAVIAITDYLSIDNYKKVVADKRLPDSVKLVLPNVEMRIQPIANDSPINIHFLFNPDIIESVEDRFFSRISLLKNRKRGFLPFVDSTNGLWLFFRNNPFIVMCSFLI